MPVFARLIAPLLLAVVTLSGCATSTHLGRSALSRVAGRTYVLVGASSGFGQGTAIRLGELKANVVLAARRTDLLEEVAGKVRAAGGQALVVTTDAARPEQMEALAQAATSRFGRIDVWMNIAGVGAVGRFWDVPVADYSRIVDVNLKGVIYGSHVALRRFMAQGHGTLVNMGSVEAEVPLAYHATYAATKAGVLSLGRSLNEELRHAGRARTIKVATVMPWAVDTPFFQNTANYSGHADRMILMDGPEKVVQALVWVSLHPREELPVGWKAQMASTAHRFAPDLTETLAADIHRGELEKGTPTPATSGSVHTPTERGRGIEGGIRARRKAENAAYKAKEE
ncbi:SDR family NAD(P)-dependent oxidoreductase [Sphingomonas jatrophae]|uniref:Short-chain dehydrogenase n=1 Tax=Sphingomonas jatrophae TaxID=1166337 RepID=A0A1I6M2N5_9SPHN|nr:SDR family NAD(P)-dependent oxidoreductase [Sphingomonas jatrophae]SFS09959.1 Short-chain dehydrogenase [Sphingomonas jatrophae]